MKLKPTVFWVFLCIAVSVQAERVRTSLDAGWTFHLGNLEAAQTETFDDSGWRTLDVPHDWSIECEFSQTNANQNAWLPGGFGWYRKSFELSAKDAARYVEVQFDGVYKHATVWVNGREVGTQYDGYTSFYLDITPYVKEGKNVMAVRVDNSVQPNCRWYTGSGIYRHVWLTVKDKVHIENWGTFITTPEVSEEQATIQLQVELKNPAEDTVLKTAILDPVGIVVAENQILNPELPVSSFQFQVSTPQLWSIESPTLYTAVSRVVVGGKVVDEVRSPFGIREIRFDAKKGFFLNGKNLKIKASACMSTPGRWAAWFRWKSGNGDWSG